MKQPSTYTKLVQLLRFAVLIPGVILSACNPNTVDPGLMPEIIVAAPTSAAIQAAIDAAPSTGARIVLPAGDYRATALVNLKDKSQITIDGQGKANWIGNSAVPNLFVLLGTCRNIRLTGINFSTTAGPGKYNYGLLSTFDQSTIDGYEIDHCYFTSPNAPINLIYFLPYSSINESGNGRGAMQRNINIHDCVAENGGRAFCELNSHVHADGKSDVFYENFRFSNNKVTNMGTQDSYFGPALSLSGMGRNVVADSNEITEAKFCGLEFVNVQNASSAGNRFQGVQNDFSAYSISQAGTSKNVGITLTNNSGTVKGRAYILHDIESFSVTGGTFTADQKIELIRTQNGSLSQMSMDIVNDINALVVLESEDITVSNNRLAITRATNTASVVDIPTTSKRITITNNTLSRPINAVDPFVRSDAVSGNTIGPNVEHNG